MKKIIEIVRAMFAVDENDTFVPDVYGVQSFGANGLFQLTQKALYQECFFIISRALTL